MSDLFESQGDDPGAMETERRDLLLRRVQSAAAFAAGAGLLFGFLASIGLRILPTLGPAGFWIAALVLTLAGAGGGLATVARGEAIDRNRWRVVDDPLLTSGEREYAHKEAERERRWAGTVFLTAPVALAYWTAYQMAPQVASTAGTGSRLGNTPLLALLPLAGYLAGLVVAHVRRRKSAPSS
jgi:hypothetical protein